jgi:hypothetical protein
MREMLRCSAKLGSVVVAMAGITSHAGEVLWFYPGISLEELYARQPLVQIAPTPIILSLPVAESRQNLRLDCEKIGQAQSTLKNVRTRGARLVPAKPAVTSKEMPPTPDEVYHIGRNEERFEGLAQQFQCGRR